MLHFTNIGPTDLFWHLARRLYLNYGHLKLSQADSVNGRMSDSAFVSAPLNDQRQKLNKHEVPGGEMLKKKILFRRTALYISGWRSIPLPRVRHVVAQVIV